MKKLDLDDYIDDPAEWERVMGEFINELQVETGFSKDDILAVTQIFAYAISDEGRKVIFSALIKKIEDYFNIKKQDKLIQNELFPLLRLPNTVELKKEFALNFGGLEKIEKDYKHLLSEKLTSGLTLQQHIDKVKDWFNSLHGENLGNWIKLFGFAKAVKQHYEKNGKEVVEFSEKSPGRYIFRVPQKAWFFDFFIRRDKKSGQFTAKTKDKFLKWLHDNQNAIVFPMIHKGQVWTVPTRVYEYAENISTKEILFVINTSILESEFKAYVSIDIGEINLINDLWDEIAGQDATFKKYRLNSFVDAPLKFLLTLKQVYSREGNFKTESGYIGNSQTLTKEKLNDHMGNLSDRIKTHLQKYNKAGVKKSNVTADITKLLLDTIWKIAQQREWLASKPRFENGLWRFNINPGYFDRKAIASKLITKK
jgi:hypothetical protein